MDKFVKTFDQCPNCGSTDRFCEYLTRLAKDKGLASPSWRLFMDMRDGVVFDPSRIIILPIGGKAPTYHIATDVCMDCGTIYAVELGESETVLTAQEVPKGKMPPQFPSSPNLS